MKLKRFYFFLTILLVLTIPMLATAGSWTMDNQTVMTAVSTVTGSAVATMDITIWNIDNDSETNRIAWPNVPCPYSGSFPNLDTTWKVADQYVKIDYQANQSGWGICCYSEVTNNDPKFIGSITWTTNELGEYVVPVYPSGLVSENGANVLPMIWQPSDNKYTNTGRNDVPPLSDHKDGAFTNGYYWQWKWQTDRATGSFTNSSGGCPMTYLTVPINDAGYLRDDWNRDSCSSPVFLYFGTHFGSATIQDYKLTTLTLEQYHP